MRMIDADALLDRIPNLYERREVSRWVDEAPTVDAVPVVRCKDCKWCNMGECEHKFGLLVSNDENYCSYGERDVDI